MLTAKEVRDIKMPDYPSDDETAEFISELINEDANLGYTVFYKHIFSEEIQSAYRWIQENEEFMKKLGYEVKFMGWFNSTKRVRIKWVQTMETEHYNKLKINNKDKIRESVKRVLNKPEVVEAMRRLPND